MNYQVRLEDSVRGYNVHKERGHHVYKDDVWTMKTGQTLLAGE